MIVMTGNMFKAQVVFQEDTHAGVLEMSDEN